MVFFNENLYSYLSKAVKGNVDSIVKSYKDVGV